MVRATAQSVVLLLFLVSTTLLVSLIIFDMQQDLRRWRLWFLLSAAVVSVQHAEIIRLILSS